LSSNNLKTLLRSGKTAYGVWCTLGSPLAVEVCSFEELDYVCVDLQHGVAGFDGVLPMLMAADSRRVTPLVRALRNEPAELGKLLDAGAEGVVVPMIGSPEEAATAVSGCRYPPSGTRSIGPFRAGMYLNQARPTAVNDEVLCLVMIETTAAVQRIDEICSVDGLDGIYIGPSDLAVSMGNAPGFEPLPREHGQVLETIRRATTKAGLICGIHCTNTEAARRAAEQGFNMVTISTDLSLLRAALRESVATARSDETRVY
jgi:4-hydroxy-2-oxoheptanedioate aldolase